ncbi:hypothetical protein GE107_18285 [Cohnella sp. CFH 77786]|uniref:hypothetical protein n=1 Tax=Cohnella sp. CFH 77786 TaxID=2662265 RepID=UPI001C60D34A|nr:hypothetical protein [Cohnella sp. CFH 77786]MBW5448008.1 hypothetical protein [Cohnella sp. CFH 77786]
MFDPTVFENLKVALENQLYDLDNLAGRIRITGRTDRLEMAVMSREFALRFELAETDGVWAEIRLQASLQDLAAEILEMPDAMPGCSLILRFGHYVRDIRSQCKRVEQILQSIWQSALPPVQTVSFLYGEQQPELYRNVAEVRFNRQINEDQMEDLPGLIEHVLRSLAELSVV